MKNFDYYNKPQSPYFGYKEGKDMQDALVEEINTTPMTAFDREQALKDVKRKVREHAAEQNRPYMEEQARLTQEFWADARADLGYDDFLTEEGIAALESHAWEEGHSAGFSEVYNALIDLVTLAEKISKNIKGQEASVKQ